MIIIIAQMIAAYIIELFGLFHPWYLHQGSKNEDPVSLEYNILQIRKQGREVAKVFVEFSEHIFS